MAERRQVHTGLACAGGVVVGAIYEVGALCALDEAIGGLSFNDLDVYVGVSSGALIGACLANGITPHTLSRAVVQEAEPTLNIDTDILFTPALGEYATRLVRLPGVVVQALRRYLQRPKDTTVIGALAGLGAAVPVALFSNERLESYLATALSQPGRTNDFRALGPLLRIVAVNLDTADVAVFGGDGTAHVPISKAVQASSALPGLYLPVAIDGQNYIDGVARRTVHASVALQAGAKLLFCINPIVPVNTRTEAPSEEASPEPPTEDLPASLVDLGLPTVLSQTFRTLVHSRMQTGFKKYEHTYPDADVILIEPKVEDYRMFFSNVFSFSHRQAVCEHAYQTTRQYLREHADALEERLGRHGLQLRRDVLEDDGRTLYDRPASTPHTAAYEATDRVLDRLDAALKRLR